MMIMIIQVQGILSGILKSSVGDHHYDDHDDDDHHNDDGPPAYSHQSYSYLMGTCHNDEGW